MGTENNKASLPKNLRVNKNYFDFLYIIGRGGFGKVWKVKLKRTKEFFALKSMSKVKIIDRRSERSIKTERDFLSMLNHPFLVNMHFAFQDTENLYLVLDYLTGGDLRYHVIKHRTFSEKQTQFFIACILSGLEYIHSMNIIHRDIKPENLVLDKDGYVKITDFGVAKRNQKDNSSETSGTPGYMAPEVLFYQNHSFPADFFAVGVIAFEFMLGVRPYQGRSRQEIKEKIINHQIHLRENDIAQGWSIDCCDFINKLLERKPERRLGYKSISEIKEHPWMKEINFDELKEHKLISSFQPGIGDNFDRKYCEEVDKVDEETLERYQAYLLDEEFYSIFNGYTICNYIPQKISLIKQSLKFANEYKGNDMSSTVNIVMNKKKINVYKRNIGPLSSNSIKTPHYNYKAIGINSKEKKKIINNEMQNLSNDLLLHPSSSVEMIRKKESAVKVTKLRNSNIGNNNNDNKNCNSIKSKNQNVSNRLKLKGLINPNSINTIKSQRIKQSMIQSQNMTFKDFKEFKETKDIIGNNTGSISININKGMSVVKNFKLSKSHSKNSSIIKNLPNISNLMKHNSYEGLVHCLSGNSVFEKSKQIITIDGRKEKQRFNKLSKGKKNLNINTNTLPSFSTNLFSKPKTKRQLMINTFYNKGSLSPKTMNDFSC